MNQPGILKYAGLILVFAVVLPTLPQTFAAPTKGEQRVIFVLVEFPDVKHTVSSDGLRRIADGLIAFYKDQSYGNLLLEVDINENWHTASKPLAYYNIDDLTEYKRKSQLVGEAMRLADGEVDFSKYKFVVVFHAGETRFSYAFAPELGQSGCFTRLDKSCQDRVDLDKESEPSFNAFHEFGHLLGLPDLYDFGLLTQGKNAVTFLPCWGDLMVGCGMGGLSAWSRLKLGWIPQKQIATVWVKQKSNITLAPLELGNGTLAIKILLTSTRYYIIENRQPIGYDRNIRTGLKGAVVIYLADDSRGSGNGPLRLQSLLTDTSVFLEKTNKFSVILLDLGNYQANLAIGTLALGESAQLADSTLTAAETAVRYAWVTNRIQGLDEANASLTEARRAFAAMSFDKATELASTAIAIASQATVPAAYYDAEHLITSANDQLWNSSFTTPEAERLVDQARMARDNATSLFAAKHFEEAKMQAQISLDLLSAARRAEVSVAAEQPRLEESQRLTVFSAIAVVAVSAISLIFILGRKKRQ